MSRLQPTFRAAAAVLVLVAGAQADTLYVDGSLTTGVSDGSSWADAFRGTESLKDAIGSATSGDQIFVREGRYVPTALGVLRTQSFLLRSGIELYGGFLGTESSPSQRPPIGSAPTILSGDLLGNDGSNMFDDNCYHVVKAPFVDSTAILDGFVISGGNANGTPGSGARGGGILIAGNTAPVIRNCTFTNNRCSFGGGAAYIYGLAEPTFSDCQFVDNFGGNLGGAVYIVNASNISFDRCTFTGNQAARAGAVELYFTDSTSLTNCLIYGNTATGSGGAGGIWTYGASNCQIRNCTIASNTASAATSAGIRNASNRAPSVVNCILWGNMGLGGAQNEVNQTNTPVTYSIVMNGGGGLGNSSANPWFTNAAGDDYSLSASSPAIDAGSNAGVPAGVTTDVLGNPRYADVPTVVDTGVGAGPIVDIGAFEARDSHTLYCFGDGSGTQCPCGNNSSAGHIGGCAHENGEGATLLAGGAPSVATDTLNFILTGAAVNTFGLLVSGTNQLPQMGACMGCGLQSFDGLRCAGGNFLRHGSRSIDASGATPNGWGPPAGPTGGLIAVNGFSAGQTRNFFAYFRTALMESCGNGQNSSNGVSVTITN